MSENVLCRPYLELEGNKLSKKECVTVWKCEHIEYLILSNRCYFRGGNDLMVMFFKIILCFTSSFWNR